MNRRHFFKLLAGAALAPVAAKAAQILPDVPILWGDGIHDDTLALQALIDGDVVEFADPVAAKGAGWFANRLQLPSGTFRITSPIKIENCLDDFELCGAMRPHFLAAPKINGSTSLDDIGAPRDWLTTINRDHDGAALTLVGSAKPLRMKLQNLCITDQRNDRFWRV